MSIPSAEELETFALMVDAVVYGDSDARSYCGGRSGSRHDESDGPVDRPSDGAGDAPDGNH